MANGKTGGSYDRYHTGAIRRIRFFVVLALLAAALFVFVFGVAVVHDDDMAPAYRAGRPVFYLRLGAPGRGDVAVLDVDVRGTVLRRVVGVPGDTVDLHGGIVYVNGLAERGSYSITRTDAVPDGAVYPLILREGEYFVLGDRRETALDSRFFGLVTTDNILGRLP
ncbi:MAG: signal peptidase I [Oscillospiraceae bacterium]|nr:signal peptidase I [Oscillospiraceae bacterium]